RRAPNHRPDPGRERGVLTLPPRGLPPSLQVSPPGPDRPGGCPMLLTRRLRRLAAGVAAAALGAVAACTTDSTAPASSGSNNSALSAPEASLLGEAVAADAQSVLDGATLSGGLFLPGLAAPIAPFASARRSACPRAALRHQRIRTRIPCRTPCGSRSAPAPSRRRPRPTPCAARSTSSI